MATKKFDIMNYLKTEDDISGFIEAAIAENAEVDDDGYIPYVLGLAARARGMMRVARETKLSREHLYNSLSRRGNPAYKTIGKIASSLGYRLTLTPLI